MKPYYESGGITIYHGDCREVLPTLTPADILVTDPPYIGMAGSVSHNKSGVAKHRRTSPTVRSVGDIRPAEWLPLCTPTFGGFVFCSWHFVAEVRMALPGIPINLFTWHKRNAPLAVANRPRFTTELIWAFETAPGINWRVLNTSMFDIPNLTAGCVSTGERLTKADGRVAHPTQKPRDLMRLLLQSSYLSMAVLDPFAGTGTTLQVAREMGLAAIGIEIEERYCEIAARRLDQEVLELNA